MTSSGEHELPTASLEEESTVRRDVIGMLVAGRPRRQEGAVVPRREPPLPRVVDPVEDVKATVQNKMLSAIELAEEALAELKDLARSSEHPAMYGQFRDLFNSIVDAGKKLVDTEREAPAPKTFVEEKHIHQHVHQAPPVEGMTTKEMLADMRSK